MSQVLQERSLGGTLSIASDWIGETVYGLNYADEVTVD